MLLELKEKVLDNKLITKSEAMSLLDSNLKELCSAADEIRKKFCENKFELCAIINGKSGKCSEDCKFCAQSGYYSTEILSYQLIGADELVSDALKHYEKGVLRYSIVTSGRKLNDEEIDKISQSYSSIKQKCGISLCASHGLLLYEQLCKLKKSGVSRYHTNLETSRNFFPKICTTHTYDDKIATIKAAQKAGLSVCSGGIMGLGENMEDRIDMALELRKLGVESVPINILNPIIGTPFENMPKVTEDEIRRIIAIYRFVMPKTAIRMAGGRGLIADKGKAAFASGANAAITGDMLTTSGISVEEDKLIIKNLGFSKELL